MQNTKDKPREKGEAAWRVLHAIPAAVGLLVFLAALFVLAKILRQHHPREIWREIHSIPTPFLCMAIGFTACSFLLLTLYDYMAVRYLDLRVKYPAAARAALVGYAFSNVTGPLFLSGGAVRYRFYSPLGLSLIDITKIMLFSSLTFWLGFLSLSGLMFVLGPSEAMMPAHFTPGLVRLTGLVFIAIVSAYVTTSLVRRKPMKIGPWEFVLPTPKIAAAQIAIGALDWMVAGGVLYALLPRSAGLGYFQLMQNYLLAQFLAIITMVPGGWGVFDVTLGLLLSRIVPEPSVVAGPRSLSRGLLPAPVRNRRSGSRRPRNTPVAQTRAAAYKGHRRGGPCRRSPVPRCLCFRGGSRPSPLGRNPHRGRATRAAPALRPPGSPREFPFSRESRGRRAPPACPRTADPARRGLRALRNGPGPGMHLLPREGTRLRGSSHTLWHLARHAAMPPLLLSARLAVQPALHCRLDHGGCCGPARNRMDRRALLRDDTLLAGALAAVPLQRPRRPLPSRGLRAPSRLWS